MIPPNDLDTLVNTCAEAFSRGAEHYIDQGHTSGGAGYFAVGEFSREVWLTAAMLFPPMLVGIYIGNRLHHGMNETVFRRTVACLLMVSGAALLIK